ncbi:MAG: ACT domain-containing protein [Spartobacteria bacterium]|nr:ACT domain-containing protein [Spartobacteria bacterium]
MAKQLNIFIENKPGRIESVTGTLYEANINVRAIEIQDRGDFGIMKLLVDDPQKAYLALSDLGLAVALRDVLAIIIEDKPGGLHKLAKLFTKANINMIDAYGFVIDSSREGIWCVEVEDYEATRSLVEENGFKILSEQELYEL